MSKLTPSLLEKLQQISKQAKTIDLDKIDSNKKVFNDDFSDEEDLCKRKRSVNDLKDNKLESTKKRETPIQSNKNEEYLKYITKTINSKFEKELKIIQNTREINNENHDENNHFVTESIEEDQLNFYILLLNDTYQCFGFHLQKNEDKWNISFVFDCKLEFFSYKTTFVEKEKQEECELDHLYKKLIEMLKDINSNFKPLQLVVLN